MELTKQRSMSFWKGCILVLLASVLALELPGRAIYHLMRAKPHQPGFTYRINSAGHRDNLAYNHLAARLIFLTGGSAAWALGSSDNEHTVSAYLERSINRALHGQESVRVLNFAGPAYGRRQESLTILDHLDMKPELVIFYDGVDDLETILSAKEPQHYRQKPDTESALQRTAHDLRDLSMTW